MSPGPGPAGLYSQAVVDQDLVRTAGMTPRGPDGRLCPGVVGTDLGVEAAAHLAARCVDRGLAAAAQVVAQAEGRRELQAVVELVVYVRADAGFTQHSAVADGASRRCRERFPDAPLPARAAVGVSSLPGGSPVEVSLLLRTGPAAST